MTIILPSLPQEQIDQIAENQKIIAEFHQHLCQRGTFPHCDQSPPIRALFSGGARIVQLQCGRSFGKTHDICYITWRFALTHPNTETYIICPQLKQAKKIYWFKRRIQDYGPRHFVLEEWESKLQVIFKNGAYIILDGCENYDALRGIKPDLVVYDEFQHHTQFFDEEVMQPNLSSGDVSLVVAGTPPKRHCYYVDFRKNVLDKIKAGNKKYFYVELPTSANPRIDREWLAEKKADLFAKGKQNVWYREYEGKLMFDTESAIFPQFNKQHHVKPRKWIEERLYRDRKKLVYYDLHDPGTSTCFASLFLAHNPYTSEVFILNEIYEKNRKETCSTKIWRRADAIKLPWNEELSEWRSYYDEAAAWFENEVSNEYPDEQISLLPVKKQKRNTIDSEEGRPGESAIMNLMEPVGEGQLFYVNEECENFIWEIENYVKDELGRYPEKDDHLMDNLFYFIYSSNYTKRPEDDTEEMEREERRSQRVETLREAATRVRQERDWSNEEADEFYETAEEYELWQ